MHINNVNSTSGLKPLCPTSSKSVDESSKWNTLRDLLRPRYEMKLKQNCVRTVLKLFWNCLEIFRRVVDQRIASSSSSSIICYQFNHVYEQRHDVWKLTVIVPWKWKFIFHLALGKRMEI